MAITSSQIQEAILNCLRSGTSRTTREIKHHLETAGIRDYTPGQFSGSINTLCRQKNIKCVSRGTYRINEVIETIMQTSLKNVPREEDPNLAMMKLLLPKLLESPEMLQNLMKLSDAVKKVN